MHLPFYQKACLDSAPTQLTDILKKNNSIGAATLYRKLKQARP